MFKRILVAALAAAVASCATEPSYPAMRPLTQAHIQTMAATPVVVAENNNGVEKSWFFVTTSSAGAAYGLIGALTTAVMDAIINAGPSMRARKAAGEMAEVVTVDFLNQSLANHLREQAPPDAATAGVVFSEVQTAQRLTARDPLEDVVQVSAQYTLSEDASTLRVSAYASFQSAATPYATPYQFERTIPRAERDGPAYRNTFTYYSSQLPVPTLTPELRERLVVSIQDSARDESGALPEEGSQEHRAMVRELEKAHDDNLTKDEIAIFLAREWSRDNGQLLRAEIERAHAFIARYVLLDLNRPVAPSLTGQDELIETLADNRTVRRVGAGTAAGSYVSSAANLEFSTYGNAIQIAQANTERAQQIRAAERARH